MTATTAKVELSGPFFRRDPEKTMLDNIHDWMVSIADKGEGEVRRLLSAGSSGRATITAIPADRVAEHVYGRVKSLSGKSWLATAVVSVNNSGFSATEGISLMAAASEVEGRVHAFRKVASSLRRLVRTANLTKGLE